MFTECWLSLCDRFWLYLTKNYPQTEKRPTFYWRSVRAPSAPLGLESSCPVRSMFYATTGNMRPVFWPPLAPMASESFPSFLFSSHRFTPRPSVIWTASVHKLLFIPHKVLMFSSCYYFPVCLTVSTPPLTFTLLSLSSYTFIPAAAPALFFRRTHQCVHIPPSQSSSLPSCSVAPSPRRYTDFIFSKSNSSRWNAK